MKRLKDEKIKRRRKGKSGKARKKKGERKKGKTTAHCGPKALIARRQSAADDRRPSRCSCAQQNREPGPRPPLDVKMGAPAAVCKHRHTVQPTARSSPAFDGIGTRDLHRRPFDACQRQTRYKQCADIGFSCATQDPDFRFGAEIAGTWQQKATVRIDLRWDREVRGEMRAQVDREAGAEAGEEAAHNREQHTIPSVLKC